MYIRPEQNDGSPPSSSPLHLCQRRLGLGQPERHVHGTIHLDSHGQRSADLFPLAYRGIQSAEAPVAVGLERTHAECLGRGEGLAVVSGGLVDARGNAMRGDVAEEA